MNGLAERKLAPRTVRAAFATLHSALRQAVRWKVLPSDPSDLVELPRQKRARDVKVLGPEQAAAFVEAARGERLEAFFVLALTTGCRPGELGALRWEDVDLACGTVAVHRSPVLERGVDVVIDLEGGLDHGVPTVPNQILYVYFPIYDEDLPNLAKLDGVARMGADLVRPGHRVLSYCGMGFNRSALVAGRILVELGVPGPEAVVRLRAVRPGALFNEVFAAHLESLPARPSP